MLVDRKDRREVGWQGFVKEAVRKNSKFVLNAIFDRQPVKLGKERGDVITLAFTKD